MMDVWSEGSVAGIDYTHAFYPELTPTWLSFALLLKGVAPPPVPGPDFAYCELGCGQGLTANLLAAIHPQAQFHGVDLLPAHMDGARALAEDSFSPNVTFTAESFAQFAARPGPDFDVIALHGVWSWVSAEDRARLIHILGQRLKPGGAVTLSYNCLPGWAADMPVRELLLGHVLDGCGPLPQRLADALSFAQKLARQGGYFDRIPSAARHLDSLPGRTDSYLAHEYLNRDWQPFYHSQVAADLAAADLSFAASATLLDHLPLGAEPQALLDQAADPARRETLRDYLTYTRFRRDVFVRQPRRLPPEERRQRLEAMGFGLCLPANEVPASASTPIGDISIPPGLHSFLVDALSAGPRPLSDLLEQRDFDMVLHGLTVLVALGAVVPVPHAEDRAERCAGFNRAVLNRNRHSPLIRQLASPVLGGGLVVDVLDRLFLLAEQQTTDPAAFAWAVLQERGQEENLAEIRRLHGQFMRRRRALLGGWGI